MSLIIEQTLKHKETHRALKLIAEDLENFLKFKEVFVAADKIVGAQFYYTRVFA